MSEPNPVEVKVFGNEPAELRPLANQISSLVTQVPGTADVFNGITIAGPSVVFSPKSSALLQFGTTPLDLQNQLTTRLMGNEVGTVLEGSQLIRMRLKYPDAGSDLQLLTAKAPFLPPMGAPGCWPTSPFCRLRFGHGRDSAGKPAADGRHNVQPG